MILSNVDGLYTAPPGMEGSRILHTFSPADGSSVVFGSNSKFGTGGMESKVNAAMHALKYGTATVICNGSAENAITNVIKGRKMGTFFTTAAAVAKSAESIPAEEQAVRARDSGRALQLLSNQERAHIVQHMAQLLIDRQKDILEANDRDVKIAMESGKFS